MPEEEAFCVFVRLMQEYRLRELFKPSMAELGLCIYQFEYMLQVSGTRVALHLPLLCSAQPWAPTWAAPMGLFENSRAEKSGPDIPAQKVALVPRGPCGTVPKHTSRAGQGQPFMVGAPECSGFPEPKGRGVRLAPARHNPQPPCLLPGWQKEGKCCYLPLMIRGELQIFLLISSSPHRGCSWLGGRAGECK